jgi:hypothetical protein
MTLVAKLALLTQRPMAERLNSSQKEKIREQLQGLDTLAKLSEEDAQQRLDAVLEVLKDEGENLAWAGFHWEGQKAGPAGAPLGLIASGPNPFKDGFSNKQLELVRDRLAKAAP